MKNIHAQTLTHTHTHTEAPGDHQRGCYQIWTECIRGFSKEVFLDWFKACLVGHYCGWKNTGPMHDTFDLDKLAYAATTAKDDEIFSLFLFAPRVDLQSPAPVLINTQSTRIWTIYGAIHYGCVGEGKNKHMMFWRLYLLLLIWSAVSDLCFGLTWNVDVQHICLTEWRHTLPEFVLLHNVPLVHFHN